MIKDSELKMIKELEKEIGKKLGEISFEKITQETKAGYAFDKRGDIVGLNLDKMKLKSVPLCLLKFKHLKTLSFYENQLTDISALKGLSNLSSLYLN